jgi:hypothetical protein
MGMYDEFGEKYIQIKAGKCRLAHYKIGDAVPLSDGVYIAYEGTIVIKDRVFIAELDRECVFDKWGGLLDIDLNNFNPTVNALKAYIKTEG